MKKRKNNRVTAASILAGTILATAVILPGCNEVPAVYGPPPDDPEYDPSNNVNEDVYGPPVIEEEEPAEEESETPPSVEEAPADEKD